MASSSSSSIVLLINYDLTLYNIPNLKDKIILVITLKYIRIFDKFFVSECILLFLLNVRIFLC
jgi:hypothetical protein